MEQITDEQEAFLNELDEESVYQLLAIAEEQGIEVTSDNILDVLQATWTAVQESYQAQGGDQDPRVEEEAEVARQFAAQAAEMEALQERLTGLSDLLGSAWDDVQTAQAETEEVQPVFAVRGPTGYEDEEDDEDEGDGDEEDVSEPDSLSARFLEDELYASNIKLQDLELAGSYAKSLATREEKVAFFKDFVKYFSNAPDTDTESAAGSGAHALPGSDVYSGYADVLSFEEGRYEGGEGEGEFSETESASPMDNVVYESAVEFIVRSEGEPNYLLRLFSLLSQFDTPILRVRVLATLDRLIEDLRTEASYLSAGEIDPPVVGTKRHQVSEPEFDAYGPDSERISAARDARKRARPLDPAEEAAAAAANAAAVAAAKSKARTKSKFGKAMFGKTRASSAPPAKTSSTPGFKNYFVANAQNSPNAFLAQSTRSTSSAGYDYAEEVGDDEASVPSEAEPEDASEAAFFEMSGGERHVSVAPPAAEDAAMEGELEAARAELAFHQKRKADLEARRAELIQQQQAIVDMAREAGIDPAALGIDMEDLGELGAPVEDGGEDAGGDDDDNSSTTSSMDATMSHIMEHYGVDIYVNDALLTEFGNLLGAVAALPQYGGIMGPEVVQVLASIFAEFKYTKLDRPLDEQEFAAFRAVLDKYAGSSIAPQAEAIVADIKDVLYTHLITKSLAEQMAAEQAQHAQLLAQVQARDAQHQQQQQQQQGAPVATTEDALELLRMMDESELAQLGQFLNQ